MKSLYTVNRKIKEIENYEDDNKQISMTITYNQLKQIKQDLEVLEILRENLYLWYTRYWNEEIEIHTKLTTYTNPKEFKKIKQWLEEER